MNISRAARSVCEQHGEDAQFHAARRADAMREAGDQDGYRLWLRILDEVALLKATPDAARPDRSDSV